MNDKCIITAIAPIKEAEFVFVWDGGFAVATSCKVNMATKEVFDIRVSEDVADIVDVLDKEYITIDGEELPVSNEDTGDGYWYS